MRRLWVFLAATCVSAQTMTLSQAVETALRNYPAIEVSRQQIAAAAAGIGLARTAYLPRIDATAQVNRATRNNLFGMLLPQSTIPSISGPVLATNNLGTAWGTAIGSLVTWEPFDFGLRQAGVATAEAARAREEAGLKRTEYEIAVATADACLTLLAAQATVTAAETGVSRAETIQRTTGALVNAQLRPGADASRAEAETAGARTELIRAQQAVDVARALLAQYIGGDPAQAAVAAPGLATLPADRSTAAPDLAGNPFASEQNAVIEQARAQLKVLERSYFPHFYLQGAAYARGTGADVSGKILGGANGLAPTTQNYVLGFSVTFPVFDFAALREKEAAQTATIRAQQARAQQIALELRARWNAAVATLTGARRITANTPTEVSAARAAAQQASARYQSGLGNIDAVAEAQRLVTQSEIDDALARLGVWRGLLGIAAAAGDIRPWLAEVENAR